MTRTHVMPRLNARVLGAATKVLDLTSTTGQTGNVWYSGLFQFNSTFIAFNLSFNRIKGRKTK